MISIIIPVYNKEFELEKAINRIEQVLAASRFHENLEILLVDDGSTDSSLDVIHSLCEKKPFLKSFSIGRNLGKGGAIIHGLNQVNPSSKTIGFMDADLDIDPEVLTDIFQQLDGANEKMIIGSKYHPLSQVDVSFNRRQLSKIYRFVTGFFIGISVSDSQTGLKFFTGDFYPMVVAHNFHVKSFAFDVELIVVAERNKIKILEHPIKVSKTFSSTVSVSTGIEALYDLWKIRTIFKKIDRSLK